MNEAGGFLKIRAFFRVPFVISLMQHMFGERDTKAKKKPLPQGFHSYKDKMIAILEQVCNKIDDDSTSDILWIIHLMKKDFAPTGNPATEVTQKIKQQKKPAISYINQLQQKVAQSVQSKTQEKLIQSHYFKEPEILTTWLKVLLDQSKSIAISESSSPAV